MERRPPSADRRPFSAAEITTAISGAILVQGLLLVLLLAAGAGRMKVKPKDEAPPAEVPMAVKPVADDLPLLKQGGAAPKLPDAWQKKAPVPVVEPSDEGAPSPQAKDDANDAAKKPLSRDAGAPANDAAAPQAVASNSADAPDSGPVGEVVGPGAPNGSPNGTETDPLKARALDQYRARLLAWFNSRFRPPEGVPCDELKKLSAGVSATVGADRSVQGFNVTRPSGNDVFDARVRSTMESVVGQELPPPPQNYPDLDVGSTVTPVFSGAGAKCETRGGDAKNQPGPAPGPAPEPGGDNKPQGGGDDKPQGGGDQGGGGGE